MAKAVSFVLLDGHSHHQQVYELTGHQCENGPGLAEKLSSTLKNQIAYHECTMDEYHAILKELGFSECKIQGILSMYESINRMDMLFVSPDFPRYVSTFHSRITREKPTTLDEFMNLFFQENREE